MKDFSVGVLPFALVLGVVAALMPVSYTHLDVYKRQIKALLDSEIKDVLERSED